MGAQYLKVSPIMETLVLALLEAAAKDVCKVPGVLSGKAEGGQRICDDV